MPFLDKRKGKLQNDKRFVQKARERNSKGGHLVQTVGPLKASQQRNCLGALQDEGIHSREGLVC
jgi:hypothetical protein